MDLWNLTLIEAVSKLKRGEIRATEYVEALLQRCERHRELNAFIYQDFEMIREAARHADEILDLGIASGPLHGAPIILKDNIDTATMPTTGGTPALKDHRPSRNAPIAQALINAGAIIFGKANLHELAQGITNNNRTFGPARNPYDPDRIPGGSSGGCGVAVGARLAPAAIGTDTGGSVRIPAALCGIIGFRPTIGRYPQGGIIPISHTRDTAGPMTRSVADVVLLDKVITGSMEEILPARLRGLRLGVPRAYFYENIDPAVADVMESALIRLRDYGIDLIEADLPDVGSLDRAAGFVIALYEGVMDLNQYLAGHQIGVNYATIVSEVASPDLKAMLSGQLDRAAISKTTYLKAMNEHRPRLQALYHEYFAKHHVNGIIFPTTPLPAVPIGDDQVTTLNGETVPTFLTFIRNTSPESIAGIPGMNLPAGLSSGGLPIGMEIDGPFGSDNELLSIGLALEECEPALPVPNLSV